MRKGHSIRICAMKPFKDVIETVGFEYTPLAGSAELVMEKLIRKQVSFVE